ncbi:unnamed protein product, partial [Tenebrio molitor]
MNAKIGKEYEVPITFEHKVIHKETWILPDGERRNQ